MAIQTVERTRSAFGGGVRRLTQRLPRPGGTSRDASGPPRSGADATASHQTRPARRLTVWLRRYLPAELCGLPAALLGGWLGFGLGGDLGAAIGAIAAEAAGYYLVIIGRDLRANARLGRLRALVVTARDTVIEFGPAELLDSFLVRPAALYAGMTLLPDLVSGVIVGKLSADLIFYLPTVLVFEARSRLLAALPA